MTIVPSKLHHVSRQTQRLDETRRFYMEVLGFREIIRPGMTFRGAWLYGSGIQIHLIEETFEAPSREINSRDNHIAFAIDNMDTAEQSLKTGGIDYRRQLTPDGKRDQLFFKDPDGWMVELAVYPAEMDK